MRLPKTPRAFVRAVADRFGLKSPRGFFKRWRHRWLKGRDNWWLGRLVELQGATVSIEGCRFSLDSPEINTKAKSYFAFGRYEKPERLAVRKFVDPSDNVVELGASIGVVACTTNRRLRDPGRYVAVEANPALIPLLQRNRDVNGGKFVIVHKALAYGAATIPFYHHPTFLGSGVRAVSDRITQVETTGLGALLDQFQFPSSVLICDIEGAEFDLVTHEGNVLAQRVSVMILEVHEWVLGPEKVASLLHTLELAGFTTASRTEDTYVLVNQRFPRPQASS